MAPRPLALLSDPPLLLEEHVRGHAFSYATDLPALARALVPVHALAPEHLPAVDARAQLLEDGERWLTLAREAGTDTETVSLLEELGARASAGPAPASPPVLVHTDLNAGNLLVADDGAVRLLDWEAARRGPAAWDLAHALSPTTTRWDAASACTLSETQVGGFIDEYEGTGGSSAALDELAALLGPVVFRALAWGLGVRGSTRSPPRARRRPRRRTRAAHPNRSGGRGGHMGADAPAMIRADRAPELTMKPPPVRGGHPL